MNDLFSDDDGLSKYLSKTENASITEGKFSIVNENDHRLILGRFSGIDLNDSMDLDLHDSIDESGEEFEANLEGDLRLAHLSEPSPIYVSL